MNSIFYISRWTEVQSNDSYILECNMLLLWLGNRLEIKLYLIVSRFDGFTFLLLFPIRTEPGNLVRFRTRSPSITGVSLSSAQIPYNASPQFAKFVI